MYHRINGLLGDIEHSIFGIIDEYYLTKTIQMEQAINAMFIILKNTVRKLQDIYYEYVLRNKLDKVLQQEQQYQSHRHNEDMLHFTSSVLVRLALHMNDKNRHSHVSDTKKGKSTNILLEDENYTITHVTSTKITNITSSKSSDIELNKHVYSPISYHSLTSNINIHSYENSGHIRRSSSISSLSTIKKIPHIYPYI